MKILFAIGIGSFFGGIFRYLLSQLLQNRYLTLFPIGTFVVNILGCLLLGLLIGLSEKMPMSQEWRLFLATGLLGGFTTFSAMSGESMQLIRDGQMPHAIAYLFLSLLIGLGASFGGLLLSKLF